MSKLKFCPFCGGEAEVIIKNRSEVDVGYFGSDEVACVSCIRCRCRTNWFLHMPLAEIRAIAIWNTRYESNTPSEVVPRNTHGFIALATPNADNEWELINAGSCACGYFVRSNEKYCPNCGRKLLWEKVKNNDVWK